MNKEIAEKAYASPVSCPSVHFLGKEDFLREPGLQLIESCVDPLVIHHPKGHTIPRFGKQSDHTISSAFSHGMFKLLV